MYVITHLNILIIGSSLGGSSSLSGASAGDTSRASLAVRGVDSKVDVLLRVYANRERGDVDDLLSNTDMSLSNQNTGVVDGLGKTELQDLSLKTALHETLSGELKNIIERVLLLSHKTKSLQSADERRSLEEALGVLGVKGEKSTGSLSHFGKHELHAPDLTLAAETIFTTELELLVQTLLLIRTTHGTASLAVVSTKRNVRHIY